MIRPMGIVDSEQDRTVSRGGGGNRGQGPAQGQRRHVGRPPEPLGPLRHAGGECRQCLRGGRRDARRVQQSTPCKADNSAQLVGPVTLDRPDQGDGAA